MTQRIIIPTSLEVSPGDRVEVLRKDEHGNHVEVHVTERMYHSLCVLRPALISVASQRTTITYSGACQAMGAFRPQSMGRLLDVLSLDCERRGEPSLASLVVNMNTGDTSGEFIGDAIGERQDCYEFWRQGATTGTSAKAQ
jgi:hypothetical protein